MEFILFLLSCVRNPWNWCTTVSGISAVYSQFSIQSGPLTRLPGYHPAIAYPEFFNTEPVDHDNFGRETSRESHVTGSNKGDGCPDVNPDCPRECRKVDSRKCRVCRCSDQSNQDLPSHPHGSAPTRCFSMVMCMLTCKRGYRLSDVMDKDGCQACTCVHQVKPVSSTDNIEDLLHSLLEHTERQPSNEAGYGGTNGMEKDGQGQWWGNNNGESGIKHSFGGDSQTSSAHKYDASGNGQLTESSSGCSGPMCPGNSDINPMSPGSSMSGGATTDTASCSGPFCLGQGGGMSGLGGGGGGASGGMGGMMAGGGASSSSSSCTGPFCITGGMMGGAGGGGAGKGGATGGMATGGGTSGGSGGCTGPFCMTGGMMGGSGGGGGAGGAMGGAGGMGGGMGGFSPFSHAASGGSSSGCSGPFCAMSGAPSK